MNACIAKVPSEKTNKDSKRICKITRNHWGYVVLPCLCNTELDENRKKNPKQYVICVVDFFLKMAKLCLL